MQKRDGWIFIRRAMFESEAYDALTPQAAKLLMKLLLRRQIKKNKKPKTFTCLNNGHIVFTYKEAKKILGWSGATFLRYRDELIATGFLDISNPGGYGPSHPTLYIVPGCDDDHINACRWRQYGTKDFVWTTRQPDVREFKGKGFAKYRAKQTKKKAKPRPKSDGRKTSLKSTKKQK